MGTGTILRTVARATRTLHEQIAEAFGENAVVAWDRDGMNVTGWAVFEVKVWRDLGTRQGTDPWEWAEFEKGRGRRGQGAMRTDGLGCVWAGSDAIAGTELLSEDCGRRVLVKDDADPLGCHWEAI